MEDPGIIFDKILFRSLKAPGARVNRSEFLKKSLSFYCSDEQIEKAITTSVKDSGISEELLESITRKVIKNHTYKVTGISTLSGMPGGIVMVATIPADLAQFYYHVIVLAQKLAYLYGYPQFDGDDEGDEELVYQLTLFIGVMYDVNEARKAVLAASHRLAANGLSKVPGETLTQTGFYILKKNTARWVGIKVTEKTFSQGLGKIIPIVSGLVSGGISYTTFSPMAKKLKATLVEGYYN